MNKLLVVGTVAFDDIQTPFGHAEKIVGGAATYISWAATNFTPNVGIVSVIGDDFPQSELDALVERGVDMEGLEVKVGEKSFFWAGRYHSDMNGRDTLATELNVLADFKPVVPESFQEADYVMLGNLSPQVQISVLDQMAKRPKLVVLDTMNFWMDVALDDLKEVIGRIDVLTINDEEARQLSGEYSLRKAARHILKMGPKYLVIKKGEHGALLFDKDNVFFCPALPLEEVFDPTGAGDSFAGGFTGYIAKTNDISFDNMKRAIVYGSAAASYCVEKFGINRVKEVNSRDIHERVGEFVQLMAFDAPISKL